MGDSAISAWERGSSLLEKLMCDCLVRPMSLQVVEDGFTPRAPTTVMRPDGEAPLAAADEIGVEVGDTEVVDGGKLLDVDHLLDDDPLPIMTQEPVAGHQLPRRQPTLPLHPERVSQRRDDRLPANVNLDHRGEPTNTSSTIFGSTTPSTSF